MFSVLVNLMQFCNFKYKLSTNTLNNSQIE